MKILVVSDEEDPYLWDYYRPGNVGDIDLILSAGDLKAEYLSFLVTMLNRPLLYIPGNHDTTYDVRPPEGCECVDGRLMKVCGLRIAGLGGCLRYSKEGIQYTEREMAFRGRRLNGPIRRAKGLDILLAHTPPRGWGDLEDRAHLGFECFLPMLDRWKPRYFIHGHVHQRYQISRNRILQYGETTILNGNGRYILEL